MIKYERKVLKNYLMIGFKEIFDYKGFNNKYFNLLHSTTQTLKRFSFIIKN